MQSDRACALSSKADNDVELSNLLLLPLPRNASRALTIITEETFLGSPKRALAGNFHASANVSNAGRLHESRRGVCIKLSGYVREIELHILQMKEIVKLTWKRKKSHG